MIDLEVKLDEAMLKLVQKWAGRKDMPLEAALEYMLICADGRLEALWNHNNKKKSEKKQIAAKRRASRPRKAAGK